MYKNITIFALLVLCLSSQLVVSEDRFLRQWCNYIDDLSEDENQRVCVIGRNKATSELSFFDYFGQQAACDDQGEDGEVIPVFDKNFVNVSCDEIDYASIKYCTYDSYEECLEAEGEADDQVVCGHLVEGQCQKQGAYTVKNHCTACFNRGPQIDYTQPGACTFMNMYAQECDLPESYHRINWLYTEQKPNEQPLEETCSWHVPYCAIKFPANCENPNEDGLCMEDITSKCESRRYDIQAYLEISCAAIPPSIHYCPIPFSLSDRDKCFDQIGKNEEGQNQPVCAHFFRCSSTFQLAMTLQNKCEACYDPNVDFYTPGECTLEETRPVFESQCPGFVDQEPLECSDHHYEDMSYCATYYDPNCASGSATKSVKNWCEEANFINDHSLVDYMKINNYGYTCKLEGCTGECSDKFDGEACGIPHLWLCPGGGEWCAGKTFNSFCDAALEETVGQVYKGKCCDNTLEPVCMIYKNYQCGSGFAYRSQNNTCQALQNRENLQYITITEGACPGDDPSYVGVNCLEEPPKCPQEEEHVCAQFGTEDCDRLYKTYPNRCAAVMDNSYYLEEGPCYFEGCYKKPSDYCSDSIKAPICGYNQAENYFYKFDNYCEFYQTQKWISGLEISKCPDLKQNENTNNSENEEEDDNGNGE